MNYLHRCTVRCPRITGQGNQQGQDCACSREATRAVYLLLWNRIRSFFAAVCAVVGSK